MIHHHDELRGRSGDDLFFQQCAASAFDQIPSRIDLVRPVDGEVQGPRIIRFDERNPALFRQRSRVVGGGDGLNPEPGTDSFPERENEVPGGRAGAQTDDHAVLHILGGPEGGLPFLAVEGRCRRHGAMDPINWAATEAAPRSAVLSFVTTLTGIWVIRRL